MGLDPIPVNLAAIEARTAKTAAAGRLATQVTSVERFEESVSVAFNPAATRRMAERNTRARNLTERTRSDTKDKKIKEISKKAEEELANRYQQRNFELTKEQLLDLKRAMYDGISPDQVLAEVDKQFKDPYLADEALAFLESTTEGAIQESVILARQILNDRSGRMIAVGQNISPAVDAYYERMAANEVGTPTDLRKIYGEVTGTQKGHNVLFDEFSKKYSFAQMKVIAKFLLRSLGYDMKSKGPSIQPAELMRCMTDVKNLQSIIWVYNFFKSRMRLVNSLHKQQNLSLLPKITFEALAKEFMKLVEDRFPSAIKIIKQIDNMGIMMEKSKIIILSQFRDATRNLSPRIYRSPKARLELNNIILKTLESLEDEDEE